jgi:hypothetical protein
VLKFFDDFLNKKDSQDFNYQEIPCDFDIDDLKKQLADNHLEKLWNFPKKIMKKIINYLVTNGVN